MTRSIANEPDDRIAVTLETAPTSSPAAPTDCSPNGVEVTILLPCLDEAETLAICIRKARGFLRRAEISREVLVADNGSRDGSQEIAAAEGARCVEIARKDPARKAILVGDLNVAPLESDVWSHRQLLRVVSHTPIEVEHYARIVAAHDWVDAVRRFVPEDEKIFSWWSYRSPDFEENDRGRRLDHIWVTPALAPKLKGAQILREMRAWRQPSDHVPVVVDIVI